MVYLGERMQQQPSHTVRRSPLVLAHRGGKAHGRENDAETITRALAYKPDIVEVDVRKSKDGVLYCHHGSVPLGVSVAQLYRFFTFAKITRMLGKRDTLEKILEVIPEDVVVCLDLKDKRITSSELLAVIRHTRPVWVVVYSMKHLTELRQAMGDRVAYVHNSPLVFLRNLPMILGLANSISVLINGRRELVLSYNDLSRMEPR